MASFIGLSDLSLFSITAFKAPKSVSLYTPTHTSFLLFNWHFNCCHCLLTSWHFTYLQWLHTRQLSPEKTITSPNNTTAFISRTLTVQPASMLTTEHRRRQLSFQLLSAVTLQLLYSFNCIQGSKMKTPFNFTSTALKSHMQTINTCNCQQARNTSVSFRDVWLF